jgi:hypothetical protein
MSKKLDYESRSYEKFGPNFGFDIKNPEIGLSGPDVYKFYGVTDNGDQSVFGLSNGTGNFSILNDRSIEIVGGTLNSSGGVDIHITGKHGDICITAEKNGNVRIRAKNIIIDADEDISLLAGKNVNITAGKRFVIQSNQADCVTKTGNLSPKGTSTGERIFGSSQCGIDVVEDTFYAGNQKKYGALG